MFRSKRSRFPIVGAVSLMMVACGSADSGSERLVEILDQEQVNQATWTPYYLTDSVPQLVATSKAVILAEVVDAAVDEELGGPLKQVRYTLAIEEVIYDPVGLIGDATSIGYYNNTLVEDGVGTVTLTEGSTALVPGMRGYFFVTDTEIGGGRIHLVDPNSEVLVDEDRNLDANADYALGGQIDDLDVSGFDTEIDAAVEAVKAERVEAAIDQRTGEPVEVGS